MSTRASIKNRVTKTKLITHTQAFINMIIDINEINSLRRNVIHHLQEVLLTPDYH